MHFSRRDFTKLAVSAGAGLALPRTGFAAQSSKIDGVQIGAITYSFRQGVDKTQIPAIMQKIGLSEVELMSGDAEAIAGMPSMPAAAPAPRPAAPVTEAPNGCPSNSPSGHAALLKAGQLPPPPARTLTPEQEAAQKKIADWRMTAKPSTWKEVRRKYNDAGIDVQILCYNMRMTMHDDEIEYAFQMARDLGVRAISSSSTVSFAKRVAPFAEKYKMMWAGHGHSNVFDNEEFAKPEIFAEIMSFSKYIGVNLDIGHFTGAGYDPVSYIPQIHDRITNLHIKDYTKPDKCYNADVVPWGTGQTPIKEVLQLMRKNKYTFPANIEFEYKIPPGSDAPTEVAKCYDFAKKCLLG